MAYIEVILLEDLKKFGSSGDIIKVKRGYANNYLIPYGIAAHSKNYEIRKRIDEYKEKAILFREKRMQEAVAIKEKISGALVKITAASSEAGKLFGSINAKTIANKINSINGTQIDSKSVLLPNPIKEVGFYEITIEPFDGISFKVNVEIHQDSESRRI